MDKSLQMYKDILKIIEKRSTCVRLSVAAVMVKDDRIISTGWNGVPAKHEHCCEHFDGFDSVEIKEKHGEFSRKNELHAEQNCIAYAAKTGISTDGATMFVSISPCTECSKLIIASGIKSVFFIEEYDRGTEGSMLLKKSNISVTKL